MQNFSEDENLRKTALENFTRPQGIVLGAATFKPALSGNYPAQNKNSYLDALFIAVNFAANYILNKALFLFY